MSAIRLAAAVLDVEGAPLSLREIADRARYLGPIPDLDRASRQWRRGWVRLGDDGRVRLDLSVVGHVVNLQKVRRIVRTKAADQLSRQARKEQWREHAKKLDAAHDAKRRTERRAAARLRRAVLATSSEQFPTAIAIVDVERRSVESHAPCRIAEVKRILRQYDLLAGEEIRETLEAFGLNPDRFQLAELSPPQKTLKLPGRRSPTTLTTRKILKSTTGISGRPSSLAQQAPLLHGRRFAPLARLLEKDAQALYALFVYARLHRSILVSSGTWLAPLAVGWEFPGDPTLHEKLEEAKSNGTSLDIVLQASPPFDEPESAARRLHPIAMSGDEVMLEAPDGRTITCYLSDIKDVWDPRPSRA